MVTHHPKAAPPRPSQVGSHSTRTPLPAGNWGRRTSRWRKGVESASNLLRDFVLRTASHNVLSLKQPEAIELVISYMRRLRLAVCCMQETWLPGFFTIFERGARPRSRNARSTDAGFSVLFRGEGGGGGGGSHFDCNALDDNPNSEFNRLVALGQ